MWIDLLVNWHHLYSTNGNLITQELFVYKKTWMLMTSQYFILILRPWVGFRILLISRWAYVNICIKKKIKHWIKQWKKIFSEYQKFVFSLFLKYLLKNLLCYSLMLANIGVQLLAVITIWYLSSIITGTPFLSNYIAAVIVVIFGYIF